MNASHTWQLPWDGLEDPPHALLDIIRGCNIRCEACYNSEADHAKSIEEVEAEIQLLLKLRRLQSVSIVGGEVTLHPGLAEIVRRLKERGLCVEIFTNGVALDPNRLRELKDAGTDLIFLHIDSGQERPDLPSPASLPDLRRLAERKAAQVVEHGIEAGLAITAYNGRNDEVLSGISTVLESPHLHYLLVTLRRDLSNVRCIRGDLESGMKAECFEPWLPTSDRLTNADMEELLRAKLGLEPFAYVGSNVDADDRRWLSYLVATCHRDERLVSSLCMKASQCERLFLAVSRWLSGRYPMYQRQNPARFRAQLFMNAATGGRFSQNMAFLARSGGRRNRINAKKILFQCPATVTKEGVVVYCRNCPDAVVKNGALVPVCISDKVRSNA